MKNILRHILILATLLAGNSALAKLDQNCIELADKTAKDLMAKQETELQSSSKLGFDAYLALVRKQQEAGFAAIDQTILDCIEMKSKVSKVSGEQTRQISEEVFQRMNGQLGLPTNSGPGSAD